MKVSPAVERRKGSSPRVELEATLRRLKASRLSSARCLRWRGRRGAPPPPSTPGLSPPDPELPALSHGNRGQNLRVSHPFHFFQADLRGRPIPSSPAVHFSNLDRLGKWIEEVQLRGVNPESRVQSVEVHSSEFLPWEQFGPSETPAAGQEKDGRAAAAPSLDTPQTF